MKSPTKLEIKTLLNANFGYKQISKQFGLNPNTAKSHIRKIKTEAGMGPKPKIAKTSINGRKSLKVIVIYLISKKVKKFILENPFSTLNDIKLGCDLTESISTVHRYTKRMGADLKEAKKVIILSEQNKVKRLEFAKRMITKSDAYFKRIMWTDETKVQGFPNGEMVKGRSMKSSPLKTPLKSNGGGGVMFWGAISWYAYGPLVVVDGTIDSKKYLKLLKEVVVPEMEASEVPLIFQQDNASSQSAAII